MAVIQMHHVFFQVTLLASGGIDHSESGRNDQFQPDRKSQYIKLFLSLITVAGFAIS